MMEYYAAIKILLWKEYLIQQKQVYEIGLEEKAG